MPGGTRTKYKKPVQRNFRTPPHGSLRVIRTVAGLSLDELAERIGAITGTAPSRGTLSAIESGARGASIDLLEAMSEAFGLEPGSITTDYRPRVKREVAA